MLSLWLQDNAYYLPNYVATATLCYTNTPPRTSMRAPGVVQSCLFTEMVVERVATELNLPGEFELLYLMMLVTYYWTNRIELYVLCF